MNKNYEILARTISFLFVKLFRVKGNINDEIKEMKGPFLILSNHIGTYDPFLVGYFLNTPVHYVTSDAVLKDSIIGYLLKKLGVFGKKKNVKDTQLIRQLIKASKENVAIGLFPEGVRSWTGNTQSFDLATAKLVKLLKIPVVGARIKGLSLMNPRWAFKPRITSKIEIDYFISLSSDEIEDLNIEEIHQRITKDINHSDIDYIKESDIKIHSLRKAKNIEYTLFMCPNCNSVSKLYSFGNSFKCANCSNKTKIDSNGFFINNLADDFKNIASWHRWQEINFNNLVKKMHETGDEAEIFTDNNMKFYIENTDSKLEYLGIGKVSFFIDRLEVHLERLAYHKTFFIKDIETINPQFRERIEMFHQGKAYRIVGKRNGVSGIKYELAANTIWKLEKQNHKLSSYLNLS